MEILYEILDVNFNLPATLMIYIFMFFLISSFILILHVRPMLDKLYSKTPFYWFIGILSLNLLNIIFTLVHYNYMSGTFEGEAGDRGDMGGVGLVGDYSKCTKCDEMISLNTVRRFDTLQLIYLNGEIGKIKRPFVRFGYKTLGDSIVTEDSIRKNNLKYGYIVAGPMVKPPDGYTLIATIPPIAGKIDKATYIWRPIPPDDYIALGDIMTNSIGQPPKSALSCIPVDCARPMDVGEGFMSHRFFYQNMRPGQENDYLFISFWDTPMNTFYSNFPGFGSDGEPTFHNQNVYYNIVSGNSTYVKYDKFKRQYEPIVTKQRKVLELFKKVISPVDLERKRQNLGELGYFKDSNIEAITLWQAIEHYFPGNFKYQISINDQGDGLGGRRLDDIQKKLIKYAQAWIIPNKSMYVIHNKCLMKNRIDHEKKELIIKIKKLYNDFHYIMKKYGRERSDLIDYLSSHYERLKKQMRHIPDFSQKINDEDFTHFGINRLKYFHKELQNFNKAVLQFTGEVPAERRTKFFKLSTSIKKYNQAKLNFDVNLDNDNCKHNKTKLKETKKLFEAKWDKINSLFRTDKDFKIKLKNKEFDGMSDSKIDKITTSLDELSKLLKDYIRDNCR
jgi:hypothetical protein